MALHDTRAVHTTWQYSTLMAVIYHNKFILIRGTSIPKIKTHATGKDFFQPMIVHIPVRVNNGRMQKLCFLRYPCSAKTLIRPHFSDKASYGVHVNSKYCFAPAQMAKFIVTPFKFLSAHRPRTFCH